MPRFTGLLFALFLALGLLSPAPCPAADSTAEPAAATPADPAMDPDMDEGHRQFAYAHYEKALGHYLKALERNKKDAYLYFRIGLTYYMLNDFDNSHIYWLKSYGFDPDLADKFVLKMKGNSMLPTLAEGDITVTDDQHYNCNKIMYNDIIDFILYPNNNGTFTKRVIGLPYDSIEITDNNVVRNGVYLKEEYVYSHGTDNNRAIKNMKIIKVPNDAYFVLGDNRNWSYDSMYFGTIDKSAILGKVLGIMDGPSTEN